MDTPACRFIHNFGGDRIAFVFTHGLLEGGILVDNNGHGVAAHPSNSSTDPGHNNGCVFMDSITNNAKLAVYLGCDTGNTHPLHGNLLDQTCNSGAQIAIGFTKETTLLNSSGGPLGALPSSFYDYPKYWTYAFWQGLSRGKVDSYPYDPLTVKDALIFALQSVKDNGNGSANGFDSYTARAKGDYADMWIVPVVY